MNEDFEPSQTPEGAPPPKAGKPGCLAAALSVFFLWLIVGAGNFHNPGVVLVTAFACLILVLPLPVLFAVWEKIGLKDRQRYLAAMLIFILGSLMASIRTHEITHPTSETRTVISSSCEWETASQKEALSGVLAAGADSGVPEKPETQPGSD